MRPLNVSLCDETYALAKQKQIFLAGYEINCVASAINERRGSLTANGGIVKMYKG